MSFDAFGSRRKTNWAGELSDAETETLLAEIGIGTSRGYTGHEHLDRTGLIHMNGRVYDPTLGRFLSADPLVQAPYFSQSYNRYTYTFNNSLILTDPSGYGSAGAGNYAHTVGIGFTIVFAGAGGFNLGSNTTYNVKVTNSNTGTSVIRKLTGSDISNIQSMEGMSVSLAGSNARGSFERRESNRSTNTTVDVSSQTDKESPTEATQATLEGDEQKGAWTEAKANYKALEARVRSEAKDGIYKLSKADILTLKQWVSLKADHIPIYEFMSDDYKTYFGTFDTFIYDSFRTKTFAVEGAGNHKGGDINYLAIGALSARYGYGTTRLKSMVYVHNYQQLFEGRGLYNLWQSSDAIPWALEGHSHYTSMSKGK